jgi:hypothetical protein
LLINFKQPGKNSSKTRVDIRGIRRAELDDKAGRKTKCLPGTPGTQRGIEREYNLRG